MSKIKFKLNKVAQSIADQLRASVPVFTGRLKNSIKYKIEEVPDGYVIELVLEDYFMWLKNRTKPAPLPTLSQLAMAYPPLPKMNSLGKVKSSDLSPRSKKILDGIDVDKALKKLDREPLINEIKKLFDEE